MYVEIKHCRSDLSYQQIVGAFLSLGIPTQIYKTNDGWVLKMGTHASAADSVWVLQKYQSRVRQIIGDNTTISHRTTVRDSDILQQYHVGSSMRAEA